MAIRRSTPRWVWLPANPLGGAGGAAYSKLFRNDALPAADLLAREVLQNSWDAALVHELPDAPAFRFCFRFVTLKGASKARFLQSFNFESILERRQALGNDRYFPDGEAILNLSKQRQPLQLLYLEDYGTHGMYGDPKTTVKSHLYKALYILGSTSKDDSRESQGGSFGFGKSAFIGSSGLRSVVAHTRFAPRQGDGASQRLIGFTWWGEHEVGGKAFEGRAMFGLPGKTLQSGALPLVDRPAESLAASLGMPKRSSAAGQMGTTVMVVDPVVGPEEVCAAVERYWWPALEDHLMDVTIETEQGDTLVPRPRGQKSLVPFVKAYGIAVGLKEPKPASNERLASNKWRADSQGTKYGSLALVIDKDSSSLDGSVDADPIDASKPVVALIRGPRMVIEYKTFQSRLPIRGVYVASPEIDDYLREVEPPAHNTWDNVRSQQVDERAREVAKSALRADSPFSPGVRRGIRSPAIRRANGPAALRDTVERTDRWSRIRATSTSRSWRSRRTVSHLPRYESRSEKASRRWDDRAGEEPLSKDP